MNLALAAAGIVAVLVGVVHSILGEKLIFSQLREASIVPTKSAAPLRQRNIRILWATWHITSILGWGIGATLIYMAHQPDKISDFFVVCVAITMISSSVLVFIATRGRHLGWAGLLMVGLLCWIS